MSPDPPTSAPRSGIPRSLACVLAAAAGILLIAATAAAGYWQLFNSFAPYDDEGYIHLTLHQFRQGDVLYDGMRTQYGPAFYFVQDTLHRWLGQPVTHDVARFKTLVAWLIAAMLGAAVVWHVTARPVLAAAGFLALWLHLDRLGLEPGHPQEVALLLVLGILWIGGRLSSAGRSSAAPALLCGLLTGMLVMTKLNLGVLTALAFAAALVWRMPRDRATRGLRWGVALAGAALPFVLARQHVLTWDGLALPAAVAAGWAAVLVLRCEQHVSPHRVWRDVALYVGGLLGAVALFAYATISRGTSPAGLWHGMVGQHRGFLDLFYHDPPLPMWSLAWACGGLLLALWSRRDARAVQVVQWLASALLLWVNLRTLGESWTPIAHGLDDRGGAGLLAGCVPPLAWAILLPPESDEPDSARLTASAALRRLTVFLALVQPLGAYPTPGTQLAIGTVPALLVVLILTGDLLVRLERRASVQLTIAGPLFRGAVAVAALTLLTRCAIQCGRWSTADPLGLPGAAYLRLPPREAAARRRVVEHLRKYADSFVASPTSCCSLYLWTGMDPPTSRNVTFWEVMLSPGEQQAVIDVLEGTAEPRLVVDRSQAPVIYRDALLNRYLESHFTRREIEGPLEVWSPGEAPALPSTADAR